MLGFGLQTSHSAAPDREDEGRLYAGAPLMSGYTGRMTENLGPDDLVAQSDELIAASRERLLEVAADIDVSDLADLTRRAIDASLELLASTGLWPEFV